MRQSVAVVLASFDDETSLDEVENAIVQARSRATTEGIKNLRIRIEVEHGYYGDIGDKTCSVVGERPETDEELAIRERLAQAKEQYSVEQRRRMYEDLRREFEGS